MARSSDNSTSTALNLLGNPVAWLFVTFIAVGIAYVWMDNVTTDIDPDPVKKLSPENAPTNFVLSDDATKQESLEITREDDDQRAEEFLAIEEIQNAIEPLMQKAEENMDLGNYVTPRGGSAWDNYQEVLSLTPDNNKAKAGLTRIRNLIVDNAETAMESADFADAENWLVQLDTIEPEGEFQQGMRQEIAAAIEAEAARKLKAQQEQEKAEKIATALEQAEEEKQKEPINYNKIKDLYNRILEISPEDERALAGLSGLVDLILDQGEVALREGDLEASEGFLSQAEAIDADNKRLGSFRLALEARISQVEAEQAAQQAAETQGQSVAGQDGGVNTAPATGTTPAPDVIDQVIANLDETPTAPAGNTGSDTDSVVVEDVSAEEIRQRQVDEQVERGIRAYYEGDYNTSFELLYPMAEEGVARAQFRIGVMYRYGRSVAENADLSERWFTRALPSILRFAQRGVAWAQTDLGTAYELGISLKQDYERAAYWYRQAAEQDYPGAQTNLGVLYANGEGVDYSRQEAVYWLKRAAAQGDLVAIENLKILGVTL